MCEPILHHLYRIVLTPIELQRGRSWQGYGIVNLTKRSHHGQGLFYLSEKHSLTRWIPVLIDLYTSDAVGYFEKNNELSELVNLDWTWPLLLPVIEFFSQLFTGLWYSAPLAFLRGENALNRPSYVDGRDDCKHIISFASWAPLQHHNGHSSPKDMDCTQQAVWGANVYTPHLLSATMEDPEMPTHLGTQSSLSCSLFLFILSLFNYSLEIVPSPFVLDLSGCGFLQTGQICPE